MTAQKKLNANSSISIHVAFHVTIDESPQAVDVKLNKTINSIFGEGEYRRDFVSDRESGGELIYCFQVPLLGSQEETKGFFEKLKSLFIASSNLNPHFTQNVTGEESEGRKK